jgi:hypothetical protein
MPAKSCGGCAYFLKLKNDIYGGGLCDFHDSRVSSGYHACKYYTRIAYNRIEIKKETKELIND